MLPALSDELTQRFYQWEERGRGWHAFEFQVDLEPGFHPFFGHFAPPAEAIDDGKRHTIFSSIGALFSKKKATRETDNAWAEIPPVGAYESYRETALTALSVVLPKGEKLAVTDMEQLLLMLSYTTDPVSFEIIGTSHVISIQIACSEADESHVQSQIKAYFPTAAVTRKEKGLYFLDPETPTCILDFGLTDEFMRPLLMTGDLDQDPFIGLFATLEHLKEGERGVVQVLFKGVANPWAESIMRAVSDGEGGSFFADSPDMVKLAQEKVSTPLFAVCIRVIGQCQTPGLRHMEIAKLIAAALIQLTGSKGNRLQLLSQDEYPMEVLGIDLYSRKSHRLGMLLNTKELATLVHFPTHEITSQKLERDARKTKPAPIQTHGHSFIIGKNVHQGKEEIISVPASLRLKHTHVIGATGTGKSTLLLSMIAQDMAQGNGLAVLDPHGDLIEAALVYIPEERIGDVILVDPADGEFPVAFNILSAHSEIEKDILSSDLVAAFRRLSSSWGDQMNSVLANAILALLESTEGGTLMDLRRFLIEKPFRDTFLKSVSDPHIVYYWRHEYPLLKSSSIGSILTRLDTFLRPKLIRNMVAQKKGLDFEHILNSGKILLVKLSQGLIGAENSFLLGTFFVSKMYQAAMARQAKGKEERSDYFLYIDEFQNFITPSMAHILSGARKYHLGLILAHQDMQQLQRYDVELASSVVVNAGTRICFRLGDTDAKRFASGFSYFEAEDLENLHTGEAIARIEQPNFDFSINTIPLADINAEEASVKAIKVVESSRAQYGTPRLEIESTFQSIVAERQSEKVLEHVGSKEDVGESKLVLPEVHSISSTAEIPALDAQGEQEVRRKLAKKQATTQHRYLQTLIKRMAEARGYKSNIEELTPDGKGRVDVSLERNGKRIACEVCVTTEKEWEVHNIEKCLTAGFDIVISCSSEEKTIQGIRKKIDGHFNAELQSRLYQFQPDQLFQFLDQEITKDAPTEKRVKGYRVNVKYAASSDVEMNSKKEAISKAIIKSKSAK